MTLRLHALGPQRAQRVRRRGLATTLGATMDDVVKGLQGAHTVSGRLTQRKSIHGATVVDDSYNATPRP